MVSNTRRITKQVTILDDIARGVCDEMGISLIRFPLRNFVLSHQAYPAGLVTIKNRRVWLNRVVRRS